MEREALEQQLFDVEGWDDNGPGDMTFYKVTLKVPVGDFKVGDKFPAAFWVGSTSLLVLIDQDEKEHVYELKVSVGAAIDPATLRQEHSEDCSCGHEH